MASGIQAGMIIIRDGINQIELKQLCKFIAEEYSGQGQQSQQEMGARGQVQSAEREQ